MNRVLWDRRRHYRPPTPAEIEARLAELREQFIWSLVKADDDDR